MSSRPRHSPVFPADTPESLTEAASSRLLKRDRKDLMDTCEGSMKVKDKACLKARVSRSYGPKRGTRTLFPWSRDERGSFGTKDTNIGLEIKILGSRPSSPTHCDLGQILSPSFLLGEMEVITPLTIARRAVWRA